MGRFEPEITAPPEASAGLGRRLIKLSKRGLYWVHRWLGVVTCLLSVMWFLSGLVMLYVPFPSWKDEERIASLPPVAIERVRITPDEAIARAGVTSMPSVFRLETFADEPVYRIVGGDKRVSYFATSGEPIDPALAVGRWFQLRAELVSPDSANTPILKSISLGYHQ